MITCKFNLFYLKVQDIFYSKKVSLIFLSFNTTALRKIIEKSLLFNKLGIIIWI